ncbi:hypothetical protein [Streptomyces sp. NPDC049879]|uniref:hypothetical protein n=1 Tax=Streptomyces sp. NPDC049879 TaxID=3365598 RepID=UPI0037B0328C
MTINFRSAEFTDISNVTKQQRDASVEIWRDVYSSIMSLVDQGTVDAQVGQIMEARNGDFQRNAGLHDESVANNFGAMNRVASIGQEGGSRMRRAAAGGA